MYLDPKGGRSRRGEGHTVWMELLDCHHVPTGKSYQTMERNQPAYKSVSIRKPPPSRVSLLLVVSVNVNLRAPTLLYETLDNQMHVHVAHM